MAKQTKKEMAETKVDAGRAAEILDYSYNAIVKAIDSGALKTADTFERKGGKASPLIRKGDLEEYRQLLIRRYETMPHQAEKLEALRETEVLTA
jgi:hypothetical protein